METMSESNENDKLEGKERPENILYAEWKQIEGIEELPPNVAEAIKDLIRNSDSPEHKILTIHSYREAENEDGSKEYQVGSYYDLKELEKKNFFFNRKSREGRLPVDFRIVTDKDGEVIKSEIYGL